MLIGVATTPPMKNTALTTEAAHNENVEAALARLSAAHAAEQAAIVNQAFGLDSNPNLTAEQKQAIRTECTSAWNCYKNAKARRTAFLRKSAAA